MGTADFATNERATSSRLNDVLAQVVYVCTNATRPSGRAGQFIWEADTQRMFVRNNANSAWICVLANGNFTPTLASIAIGTGGSAANAASYSFAQKTLSLRGSITLGTSGQSVSGTPVITLPTGFSIDAGDGGDTYGDGSVFDSGSKSGNCTIQWVSSTTICARMRNTAGTYEADTNISSTVPITWGAGDRLTWNATIANVTGPT